jgi:hypothetical protein
MLESDYILPAQRAALYEFLATTPGLIVEPDVRDIDGRPGVGVGWSFEGAKAMNIFDPGTYAYLGLTTWSLQGQQGGDALLKTAITNIPASCPEPILVDRCYPGPARRWQRSRGSEGKHRDRSALWGFSGVTAEQETVVFQQMGQSELLRPGRGGAGHDPARAGARHQRADGQA